MAFSNPYQPPRIEDHRDPSSTHRPLLALAEIALGVLLSLLATVTAALLPLALPRPFDQRGAIAFAAPWALLFAGCALLRKRARTTSSAAFLSACALLAIQLADVLDLF